MTIAWAVLIVLALCVALTLLRLLLAFTQAFGACCDFYPVANDNERRTT